MTDRSMDRLSHVFKALSEPLRLRILRLLLAQGKEAYGEELARALSIPPYQLSRHLKVLRSSGLVQERKEGRWVYYSIATAESGGRVLASLRRLLTEAIEPESLPPSASIPAGDATRPAARESREPAATGAAVSGAI
jgi:ArsR family transcriptional regulator